MRAHLRRSKIQDALDLLNEAAKEKKEEVYEVIGDKYEALRGLLEDTVHNGQAVAEDARKRISKELHAEERKIKEVASRWDKKVRRNPWKVVGGVALGALAVGVLLGRRA